MIVRRVYRLIAGSILSAGALLLLSLSISAMYVISHMDGDMDPVADCAIVFGAGVRRSGAPSPAVLRRVRTAAELSMSGRIGRVVLSGGRGGASFPTEASVMREVAIKEGVRPDALVLEERATSTLENLQFSLPLLEGCKDVLLISDRYHLGRIRLLARFLGWTTVKTAGAGESPPPVTLMRDIARESVGVLYYSAVFLIPKAV